jgi:outer membrane protein
MVIYLRCISCVALAGLVLLSGGCEPFYDPVEREDVPTSPGTAWDKKPIVVKETAENPYDISDLSDTMPLSLLLDMALYNNPSTRVSWNASRASAYAYRASLSTYYPALSYDGALSAQTTKGTDFASSASGIVANPSTTPAAPTQAFLTNAINNLNMTYLLLDFGGRSATAELALQTLYSSNWSHDFTMQQVMLSVLNAYTSYLGNKGLVAAYEQDLKDAQVALDASKVMHTAGLATLNDVLLAQSNVELTRTNLFQAQGAEKTAFAEVLITVGLPADSDVAFEDLPQKLPVIEISGNISELLELAKQKRPDLGIAIAAIKQQEAQLAISYSSGMPTLSADANWTQVRFISPRMPSGYKETASIALSFPIFQGFFYMNQQRQLRAQIEEALANLDVQVAAVSTQVVTNYYAFKSAEAALPSSEAAVVYSQRAYRGFIIQYKTGTASILDVLTALTNLSNARSQQVLTRTQWAASLANLAFSVGVLEDTGGQWEKAPPGQLYQLPIRDDHESEEK